MWPAVLVLLLQTPATPPDPDEIERLEQEQAEAREQAEAAQREANALAAEIVALQTRLVTAAGRATANEQRALDIEAHIAELAEQESGILERLLSDREALIDVLAALQRIERGTPPALATAPGEAEEAARAASLLAAITPELQSRAEALAEELENLRSVRTELEAERGALMSTEDQLAANQAEIRELIAERRRLESRHRGDAERLADVAATAGEQARTLRELLETLRGMTEISPRFNPRRLIRPETIPDPVLRPEDGLVAARAAMAPIETLRFADARGQLRPPVEGPVVLAFRQDDENGDPIDGIRIRARRGGQVIAPFDARVEYAGSFNTYNGLLILSVGDDYYVVLAGLGAVYAEAGQSVLAGEPVGEMPTSGETAPDLYLEIRREETAIDPRPWLRTGTRSG
ncbi:peptidoglycan DD-metalloendopeptidase family protein [Hyphobacterium sp. HN65]|uniref:Peptidoglycan DD-metalloendopeptidase family protein n=1 Tax=Hyphobacterium lacteum TaxID=3116575 RepID=A0ABU7LTB6_9PROT|nr:peptidoglycan DD-metalloendopeptidase family protein [Hyphobacterium sp. HN65]MEE2526891.1 peptidoglycan DD-metalloendopeptidase family protein [Hyphobacterium sp. HN65]